MRTTAILMFYFVQSFLYTLIVSLLIGEQVWFVGFAIGLILEAYKYFRPDMIIDTDMENVHYIENLIVWTLGGLLILFM